MNHGGGGAHSRLPAAKSGPRSPIPLGLEAAQCTSNILRLLETSHGGFMPSDAFSAVWHPDGLLWKAESEDGGLTWVATDPARIKTSLKAIQSPTVASISLSDDRTALVKLVGVDGLTRFISLLRLESEFLPPQLLGASGVPNGGWFIVRELVSHKVTNTLDPKAMESLNETLLRYLSIEHGGGPDDQKMADNIFHPDSSLLSIGTLPQEGTPSEWAGITGSIVRVSRSSYLEGVASQSAHEDASKQNDGIVTLDVLPCALAAAATVEVGNGAQTNVFCDHLLLARPSIKDTNWQIVSKVFSPRHWK